MDASPKLDEEAERQRGRLLAVAASLLWSTSGFFVKAPFFDGWPGVVLAFWRSVFAGLIMLPLVRRPRWSWTLLPMMLCFAAMCYTYLTSMSLMSTGSASCALWLQCTAPVWVLLVGVFFFGEKATVRDWLLVVFSTLGVGVMLLTRSQGVPLIALGMGLASSMLYACIILSLRRLREHDSAWLSVLNQLGTAVALAPFALTSGVWPNSTQWGLLVFFGPLQLGLPYVLFGAALKRIPGHEASTLALLEPLLLPLWIYLAWGDKPDPITYVAGGFILVGLMIRYMPMSLAVDKPVDAESK